LSYFFNDYVLDPDRCELRCGATPVAIEPQVFDLLQYLIRHRDRVVSRDELIESIWGGRLVSESALSTRINAVRTAIGDSGIQQRLIKTLPRRGIRFVGEVREEQQTSVEVPAAGPESRALEIVEPHQADELTTSGQAQPLVVTAPIQPASRLASRAAVFAAISLVCIGALAWSYFARSAQAARTRADIETATKLTQVSGKINMISRENYEAVRELEQWAVKLDPHNPTAQARLTFAIVTGVLNHWSDDVVTDLHSADQALQEALRVAPQSMIVRSAQCHILRAMLQFETAVKVCGELARSFPQNAFAHKELGYDRLMLGQLDEALAEFHEADRIAPDSRMRWSWNQGIGLIHLMQGQDRDAVEELSRAALEAPDAGHPAAYLASAYALSGREQEARDVLDHYTKLWPKTSLNNFGPMIGTAAFNSKMQRVREGLRIAGLPE
jgi:DNA-binding winged helix-turn-helix (wHTH) protein/tetratricopeptide (TPR) repeat protein